MDDLKDIIKDENNNPLLLEGKTMTLNDFKKNLGRIDNEWITYMNNILDRRKQGTLNIG